jgi:hypothetical protein
VAIHSDPKVLDEDGCDQKAFFYQQDQEHLIQELFQHTYNRLAMLNDDLGLLKEV